MKGLDVNPRTADEAVYLCKHSPDEHPVMSTHLFPIFLAVREFANSRTRGWDSPTAAKTPTKPAHDLYFIDSGQEFRTEHRQAEK